MAQVVGLVVYASLLRSGVQKLIGTKVGRKVGLGERLTLFCYLSSETLCVGSHAVYVWVPQLVFLGGKIPKKTACLKGLKSVTMR